MVAVVDRNGRLVERLDYSPFGKSFHHLAGDVNGDGLTNFFDVQRMLALTAGGATPHLGDPAYEADADLNRDGVINFMGDILPMQADIGKSADGLSLSVTEGGPGNPVGYAAYWHINDFGPHWYARHRIYDPAAGRWLTRDPAGYVDGLSLYLYVHGNPLGLVDPLGLMSEPTKHWYNPFTWFVDTSNQVPAENPEPVNARDPQWQANRLSRAIESNAGQADADRMREIRAAQQDYSESGDLTDINRLEGTSDREIRNSFTGGQFNADAKTRGEQMKEHAVEGVAELATGGLAAVPAKSVMKGVAKSVEREAVGQAASKATATNFRAFRSFKAFKKAMGSAGNKKHWHHIVEQRPNNVKQFGQEALQNTENIISIDERVHTRISGFYSSKQEFTNGKTVREWLDGQSYEFQREYGLQKLREFDEQVRKECEAP